MNAKTRCKDNGVESAPQELIIMIVQDIAL